MHVLSRGPLRVNASAPREWLRGRCGRLALVVMLAGCKGAESPEPGEAPSTLRFRVEAVDGRVLEQEPPGGKSLVVFFAATDDLRSLRQIEFYEREAKNFRNAPRCIVVAMDPPEAFPLVRLFSERMAPLCAVVHAVDSLREDGGPFAPVRWVPEVFVYDGLGHEVLRSPGGATGEAIAKAARAL